MQNAKNASCSPMRRLPSFYMMGRNWKAVSKGELGKSALGGKGSLTFMTMSICDKR
jgi:hypothetical protein